MEDSATPVIGKPCPYCGSRVRPGRILFSRKVTCAICQGHSTVVQPVSLLVVWLVTLALAAGFHLGVLQTPSLFRILMDLVLAAAVASLVWLMLVRLRPEHLR